MYDSHISSAQQAYDSRLPEDDRELELAQAQEDRITNKLLHLPVTEFIDLCWKFNIQHETLNVLDQLVFKLIKKENLDAQKELDFS